MSPVAARATRSFRPPALCAALALASAVSAHELVPAREQAAAQRLLATGPAETRGVDAVRALGSVALAGEIDGAEGKILRAREIVLAPGAAIAVHEHQRRPGLAYILEGELVEHRNDADGPLVRGVGAIAFERSGVVHYWENRSDRPARALVVDIVDEGP